MARTRRIRERAKRALLEVLSLHGGRPLTLRQLQDETPFTYSTLKRAARELEEVGMIRSVVLVADRGRPPEGYLRCTPRREVSYLWQ